MLNLGRWKTITDIEVIEGRGGHCSYAWMSLLVIVVNPLTTIMSFFYTSMMGGPSWTIRL